MKKYIIIASILALTLLWVYTYTSVQAKLDTLEANTVESKLEAVRQEARALEKQKADYEALNIDKKLDELYKKSNALQSVISTGFTK